MTDEELVNVMAQLGGISKKRQEHPGLLKPFIRTLRADYKMVETYRSDRPLTKFKCDISVLRGKEDTIFEHEDMDAWRKYTQMNCMMYEFEGGHFYLHKNVENVVGIINKTLKECLAYTA